MSKTPPEPNTSPEHVKETAEAYTRPSHTEARERTAWLLEYESASAWPLYMGPEGATTDPNEALRFETREVAEKHRDGSPIGFRRKRPWTAREHTWPASSPPQQPALDLADRLSLLPAPKPGEVEPKKLMMPNGDVLHVGYSDSPDWAKSWDIGYPPDGAIRTTGEQDWELVERYGLTALFAAYRASITSPQQPAELEALAQSNRRLREGIEKAIRDLNRPGPDGGGPATNNIAMELRCALEGKESPFARAALKDNGHG